MEIEVQKADKNESNAYTEYTAMCFYDIYHGFLQNSVRHLQGIPSALWTWRNETHLGLQHRDGENVSRLGVLARTHQHGRKRPHT